MHEYSIPALVDIPAAATLTDTVLSRAAAEPQAVVLRRRTSDGRWDDVTAAEFGDQVTGLAKGLAAAGLVPGDRVALMARTRYEWTLADYAIWAAGLVTVPIYDTSSAEQVEWILADSGARAAIAENDGYAATIEAARKNVPALEQVWVIDGPANGLAGLSARAGEITDAEIEQRRTARKAADLATIIYTSGTTGRPKGCSITHANLLADVRNAVQALPEVFEAGSGSTLLFLPLAHSFARIIQIGCLESGAVLGHWPNSGTVAQVLPEFRPTFLLAVPRVFEKIFNTAQQQASASGLKRKIFAAAVDTAIAWSQSADSAGHAASAASGGEGPSAGAPPAGPVLRLRHALFDRLVYAKLRTAVGGQVQFAVSGGAPLGERLGHFFRGAGLTVLEGYGLTETSAAATVNRPRRNKTGTVGQPLPGTAVRIDADGEILLSGPNVFSGYWDATTHAAAAPGGDGWLHTGDIGSLDEEGFLRVTGRKKEIIVTAGGKNVAPAVLEDRLRAHPLISQCVVVGDGRPYVACLITLDADALDFWKDQHGKAAGADVREDPELTADIQQAVDDANKAVSRAESIRRFRILAGDFTEAGGHLTPSLKVRRGSVLKDFASDIEAVYAPPRSS